MNSLYEILTENGFRDFMTVTSKMTPGYCVITLTDGVVVKCTQSHRFKVGEEFVEARDLKLSDKLAPTGVGVSAIEYVTDEVEVFDVVNVDDGNHYITNGITSHNCDFLSSDGGLMDSYVMGSIQKEVEIMTPTFVIEDEGELYKFYAKINPLSTYIIGIDPATGSGVDYSVIQCFEFPSMNQVFEYRSNVMRPESIYKVVKKLIAFISQTGAVVYFSAENNGVGQSIISLYLSDETPAPATFVSEDGKDKYGFFTSPRSKIRCCVKMKNMIENRTIKLSSETMVKELKSYVRKAGSYCAQIGATDDCIAAFLIVIRIIEEIATYDEKAYHMMYQFEEPGAWKDEGHPEPDYGYTIPVEAMRG